MKKESAYVLDANVWLGAAISGRLARLGKMMQDYRLIYFQCPELFAELRRVMAYEDVKPKLAMPAGRYMAVIEKFCTAARAQAYHGSPDPADDYLIGLCLSTRARLITNDRLLLHWPAAPIEIIGTRDFVANFPLL